MADETTTETPAPADEKAADRAKQLYYTGELDPGSGQPTTFVQGVPARDLDEDDIRLLSEIEYDTALQSGLYRKTKPAAEKKGGS